MKKEHHKLTQKIGETTWTSVTGANWYNWEAGTCIPNWLMKKMTTRGVVKTPTASYVETVHSYNGGMTFEFTPGTGVPYTIPHKSENLIYFTTLPIPVYAEGLVTRILQCDLYNHNKECVSAIYIDLTDKPISLGMISDICRPYLKGVLFANTNNRQVRVSN